MQIALTPGGRWEFATADLVAAASTAGFAAVGINADSVDATAVEAYAAARVGCHELLALIVGDDTWDDLAAVPLDDIAYLQFADALGPEYPDRLIRESLHRRATPGEGMLDLDRFAATLLDRGYDGIVSVEVLSAQLRELPVDVLVGQLYTTTAAYWL